MSFVSDITDTASSANITLQDMKLDPLPTYQSSDQAINASIGSAATGKSFFNPSASSSGNDGSERLYAVLPRSAISAYSDPNSTNPTYTSDRGLIASIRLLSTGNEDSNRNNPYINISNDIKELKAGGFNRFFLTNVQVSYNEKVQIMTTFGDNEVVYYFGKQPVIFNISGILFDSIHNDWFTKFKALYDSVLRGSQLAKSMELVELVLPNMTVVGSIASMTHSQDSTRDTDIPFNISFIAKEIRPTGIPAKTGFLTGNVGNLLDFSVGKEGVGGMGYKLSVGSLGGGLMDSLGLGTSGILGGLEGASAALSGASSVLSSGAQFFRQSIYSPIYGIISSITKVISGAGGTLSKIISSFTNPVNSILRDIMNIASAATALANMVESSINSVLSVPERMVHNVNNTLNSLKYSAGVISRVPESVSETMRRVSRLGRLKQSTSLSSGKKRVKSKAAILSSGAPYSPAKAYKV